MNIKSILKHYWKFLKKRLLSQVVLLFSFGFAAIGTTVVVPLIYKEIINTVSNGSPEVYEELSMLIIFLAIAIVVYNIFFRIGDYVLIKSQSEMIKEINDYTLEKLQDHSYEFFTESFVGGLVAKGKRFVRAFETLHDQFIFHIWMNGIALFSSIIVLWTESWVLGASFLAWLVMYCFILRFMVKLQIPKSLINAEADTKTTGSYADIIGNILTIKMFGNADKEMEEFKKVTNYQEEKRRIAWMQENFWNGMIQSGVIGIFNIAIIWIVVDLWKQGVVPAGVIVLVQVYVITSFNIVWNISRNIIRASSALTDADEMVRILDKQAGVQDQENPEEVRFKKGKIDFKDVVFCYDKSNVVFNKLNMSINPGEKVALVGHSGAGKTTIIKLLLRFIDIQSGAIEIDGQDITKVKQDDLRNNIAYVPQDPSLFHRSIRENIAYGKLDATDKEIEEVSKKAYADGFIKKLPCRYDTLVGERGVKLSGGERQRVAIARAMLKEAPIVILDEATSALDSLVEEKIQDALEKLTKGKTTIVIAHRLSTISKMDKIIVFDKGNIVEIGTHKELLKKKGIYSDLWNSHKRV